MFEKEPLPFIVTNFFEKEAELEVVKKERPGTGMQKYKQAQPGKQTPLTSRAAASIFASKKSSFHPSGVLDREQLLKTQEGHRSSSTAALTAPKTARSGNSRDRKVKSREASEGYFAHHEFFKMKADPKKPFLKRHA